MFLVSSEPTMEQKVEFVRQLLSFIHSQQVKITKIDAAYRYLLSFLFSWEKSSEVISREKVISISMDPNGLLTSSMPPSFMP
jgi:hypothetical protein